MNEPRAEIYRTQELIQWLADRKAKCAMKVTEVPVRQLKAWAINETGEIKHESGGFFEIRGYRVTDADREVNEWDQPLVYQERMGILGILSCLLDDVRYFLLQAKVEPGNVDLVQLSPTLQATYSNLDRKHEGKKPLFADFFYGDHPEVTILYKQWLAEDGGRFYRKSNLNMLIEVDRKRVPSFSDDFRWINLRQVKELLRHDNLVGPHVRGILAHL